MGRGTALSLLTSFALALTGSGACEPVDDRDPSFVPSTERDPLTPGDAGVADARAPNGDGGDGSEPASRLGIDRDEVDFGPVVMGFAARDTLWVSNTGSAVLDVPQIRLAAESDADFSLLLNQCERSLEPGERCDVRIGVLPSKVGPLQGSLQLSTAAATVAVQLLATGLEPGDLLFGAASGGSESFGEVPLGTTVEGTFRLTNPSDQASGALTFSSSNSEFVLLDPSSCGGSLEAGATCDLRVAFTPSERGRRDATVTIQSPGAGNVSGGLTGIGLAPGALELSTHEVSFGPVVLGVTATASVDVTNVGDVALTLGAITLSGEHVADFAIQDSTCAEATALEGAASCKITLAFHPITEAGERGVALAVALASGPGATALVRGTAVEPGSLVISPLVGGATELGSVLLGASVDQVFEIANPGGQASGAMAITASGDFQIVEAAGATDCQASTSLVDAQSCTVNVRFTPTARGVRAGSLTVVSSLAGSSSLALSGTGIVGPDLEVLLPEVAFGRVVIGNTAPATLTLRNAGDQPLSPPSAVLGEVSSGEGRAFSITSRCNAELAFDETCEIDVAFAPLVPGPHSARLDLTSANGGSATALVVGEAIARGSLVPAAVTGGSTDFGDVERDTTQTRQFTLTNPGGIASGSLTFSSSNPAFTPASGDCNPAQGSGLVDGASCTFAIAFRPSASGTANATITIASVGAGSTSLAVSGRGRNSPALAGSAGSRDFGNANVGQAAVTEARNTFTWSVSNSGDLPTSTLTFSNSNTPEFEITNNSCNNAVLAGAASCQLTIRFRPSTAGRRSGVLALTDAGNRSVRLDMTGTGVQLAGPGQSCFNVACATGVCTNGVCCDRACNAACQSCSAAGQCIDQSNREPCGTGQGQCFGVDRCRLPAGQPCTGNDAECGDGNCEPRLNASGSICCLEPCATGERCNPQTRLCEVPVANQGGACGAGLPPCAQGLACVDGVCCNAACDRVCESCNAAGSCVADTGNCGNGRTCQGRGICQCPNGTRACDNRCISSAAGTCCNTAECDPFEQCDTNSNTCGCQTGAVSCNGNCRAPGSCCANADCGGAGVGTCSDAGTCACVNGAFGARCAGRLVGLGVVGLLDRDSEATQVSGDGRVVVGWSGFTGNPPATTAARWVWETGQSLSLGVLPDDVTDPTSIPTAVSLNGSVIVGDASSQLFGSDTLVAFRWTQATGLRALDVGQVSVFTRAEGITADGGITVGWADNDGGPNAGARWTTPGFALTFTSAAPETFRLFAVNGTGSLLIGELGLGFPVRFDPTGAGANRFQRLSLGAFAGGSVAAVSANGAQLVGTLGSNAVRWVNSTPGGAPSIGSPQDLGAGQALDVSNAGVVVGASGNAAVVWNAAGTRRSVLEILQAGNPSGLAGWVFQRATGISDDGLVIVGAGTRGGRQEAWVVRLPAAL